MKEVRCREIGFDCDAVVRDESEEVILAQVAQHAQQVHQVEVTPEMAAQIRTLIRDEAQSA